jgi:hypothetical protein
LFSQFELEEFSFLPFAVALFVLFPVLVFYLPETKGRQVSDVVDLFQVPNAWSVTSWENLGLVAGRPDIFVKKSP